MWGSDSDLRCICLSPSGLSVSLRMVPSLGEGTINKYTVNYKDRRKGYHLSARVYRHALYVVWGVINWGGLIEPCPLFGFFLCFFSWSGSNEVMYSVWPTEAFMKGIKKKEECKIICKQNDSYFMRNGVLTIPVNALDSFVSSHPRKPESLICARLEVCCRSPLSSKSHNQTPSAIFWSALLNNATESSEHARLPVRHFLPSLSLIDLPIDNISFSCPTLTANSINIQPFGGQKIPLGAPWYFLFISFRLTLKVTRLLP